MLDRAEERGVEVVQGVAEALPFECSSFDYTLMVIVLIYSIGFI
jgi:ubiquinone/menaquinone biosynthesis C-methylase UbiE